MVFVQSLIIVFLTSQAAIAATVAGERTTEPAAVRVQKNSDHHATKDAGTTAATPLDRVAIAVEGAEFSHGKDIGMWRPKPCRCSSGPQARTVRRQDRRPRRGVSGCTHTDRERGHDLNRSLRSVLLRAQLALRGKGMKPAPFEYQAPAPTACRRRAANGACIASAPASTHPTAAAGADAIPTI